MDNTMKRLKQLEHNYCAKIMGAEIKYLNHNGKKSLHLFYVFCNGKIRNYLSYRPKKTSIYLFKVYCSIHSKEKNESKEQIFIDKVTAFYKGKSIRKAAEKRSLRKKIYSITDKNIYR